MSKIAVIFGGKSVEHDISIITGLQILRMVSKNYDVLPIYIDGNGEWWTANNLEKVEIYSDFNKKAKHKKRVGVVFGKSLFKVNKKSVYVDSSIVCCHGVNGEDGSVAAILDQAGIPYTSSSMLSSAICMDKAVTKIILKENSIKTPEFKTILRDEKIREKLKDLNYPLIVKPANLGSSVGINVCHSERDMQKALNIAFNFDNKVLVEEFLENSREFNCACFLYNKKLYVSNVNEVEKSEFFSFEEKYLRENEKGKKEIDQELIENIKDITKKVYKSLECFGVVRVDFLLKEDVIFVNEVNSIPGALACYLFDQRFDEILDLLIIESKKRLKERENIKYSFKSNALKVFEDEEKLTRFKK